MADGGTIHSLGETKVSIKICNHDYNHSVLLAEVEADAVIGFDFLKQHGCIVNFKSGDIQLNKDEPTLSSGNSINILLSEKTTIPAFSETIIPGILQNGNTEGVTCQAVLAEPSSKFKAKEGLLLARMLVNSDQKDIPLRVVNVGNKPILLQEKMKVATCETVTDVDNPIPSVSTIHDDSEAVAIDDHNISSKIPSHLTKLYEDCIGSLTLKQQSKVADLLVNVQHIFAHDKNDIGKTSLIKHRLNTKDTQPIK